MVSQDLITRARKGRDWMLEAALPFWAERSVHPELGFRERLDFTGLPIDDATSRVRLQARQCFCYAYGKLLGFDAQRADELIARGLDVLLQHCRREDGLMGAHMSHQGGLSDTSADLYDTAFALLAFSWAARAGHVRAAGAARDLSAAIERELRRPAEEGGYREKLPAPANRAQNPHMHLYESSLACFEGVGEAEGLERARRIESLLELNFLQRETGALREIFAPGWGPHEADQLEAGHQYEWVWLMGERARLDGKPVSGAAEKLYQNALSLTGPDGEVALSHHLDGTLKDATERTWGLTEALKAHLSRLEHGDPLAERRAIESFDRMWARHVDPAPEGGWLDKYDAEGKPATGDMTAATGYHIYVAIGELMRVAGVE